MKRVLALVLVMALGISLCACRHRDGDKQVEVYDAYGEYEGPSSDSTTNSLYVNLPERSVSISPQRW